VVGRGEVEIGGLGDWRIGESHAEAQRYRERRGIWELRLRTRDSSGSEDWGIGGFSRGERVERVEGIGGLEDLAVENV